MKERICCVCRAKDLATKRIRVGRIKIDSDACDVQIAKGASQCSKTPTTEYRFFVDEKGNGNGRGAYVCFSCIDTCVKKRQLNRVFKCQVPEEVYKEIANLWK